MSKDNEKDEILNEIKKINQTMDNRFDLLDNICSILEALKALVADSDIEDDIAYIRSSFSAIEYSPRALSRSEAAVQNTQILIEKVDKLLKKTRTDRTQDIIFERLDRLENIIFERLAAIDDNFNVFLEVFETEIEKDKS